MKGKYILVVDDEEDTVELARMVLEYEGYSVISATNGREAITYLENTEEVPDLILLDVIMPKMDGIEVCRWIKENKRLKHIPVFLFTAKVGSKDRATGKKVGADAYINKPFSADNLVSLIKSHLKKSKKKR